MIVSACSSVDEPVEVRVFDACEPLRLDIAEPTDAWLAGVDAATAAWRSVGVTTMSRDAATDVAIAIRFTRGASSEFGLYDGRQIDINDELDGDALAVVIAHELGHAVGLVHVAAQVRASVMNPGNLVVAPTADDREAVAALWGSCP